MLRIKNSPKHIKLIKFGSVFRRFIMRSGISSAILGVVIFLIIAKKTNMVKK